MNTVGVYEAMSTLRAVRRLKPDPIPQAVLHRVLEAATWAPTGSNRQPWRVIVVRKAALKRELGRLYAEQWRRFSAAYESVLAAMEDNERTRQEKMVRAGDYLAEHYGETPAILVFCFNPKLMAITDAALERPSVVGGASIYTAVENALLACRAEGLGCTLTTLLCVSEPEVKALLGIPEGWGTAAYLPIGYPKLRGHGPITRRPVAKLAYADEWKHPFE